MGGNATHEGGAGEGMSEGGGQGSLSGHDGGAGEGISGGERGEGISGGERQGGLSGHEGGAREGTSEGATVTRLKEDRLLLWVEEVAQGSPPSPTRMTVTWHLTMAMQYLIQTVMSVGRDTPWISLPKSRTILPL